MNFTTIYIYMCVCKQLNSTIQLACVIVFICLKAFKFVLNRISNFYYGFKLQRKNKEDIEKKENKVENLKIRKKTDLENES